MKRKFLFCHVLMAGLFYCCQPKENIQPGSDEKVALQNFFKSNEPELQTFTVDIRNGSATIYASQGTEIIIPEDAFVKTNGDEVNGPIEIVVKEIYNRADMVLSNITSVSNGTVLESNGEIFINATLNGEQLAIADSSAIIIGVAKLDSTNPGMQLFMGEGDGDNFDWEPVEQDSIVDMPGQPAGNDTAVWNGSVFNNPYFMYDGFFCSCYNATKYFTSIKQLGWINIDCLLYYAIKNIQIHSPGFDKNNSSVFVVLKNRNSAINVYADIAYHNGWYELSLPDGEDIKVIAIGHKDGKFYLDIKDYTVSEELVISLNLQETSENDLESQIINLF